MIRSTFWMIGALTSFCLMAVGARELNGQISVFQILFFRSIVGLLVLLPILLLSKRRGLLFPKRMSLHVVRNLFHFAGQYGWFLGIGLLPLATVFAIEFTVPFWTILISSLFLKESITLKKIIAVLLGILGVIVIVQPSLEVAHYGSLIVLSAAICYALSHVATKSLSNTQHPLSIIFMMCLIQAPLGLLLFIEGWTTPVGIEWLWLVIVGLTALSAHYCMTKAMQYAEVTFVVTMDMFRLPLISLIGVLLYSEHFSVALVLGMLLIVAGNGVNIYSKRKALEI
ncbi:DMT family transporter [Psychrobacter sp. F1192]|uniref:DMT family transporter n=1 Tax=Psychrobacter coccoides TaxID=2818440 RepID=A0ABS3NKQ0_9GAMM|nr:DMT family transporter [Psychrobacter coccoides]MBO1529801.1 DMT family transporter [Psychrobacter coccoides]